MTAYLDTSSTADAALPTDVHDPVPRRRQHRPRRRHEHQHGRRSSPASTSSTPPPTPSPVPSRVHRQPGQLGSRQDHRSHHHGRPETTAGASHDVGRRHRHVDQHVLDSDHVDLVPVERRGSHDPLPDRPHLCCLAAPSDPHRHRHRANTTTTIPIPGPAQSTAPTPSRSDPTSGCGTVRARRCPSPRSKSSTRDRHDHRPPHHRSPGSGGATDRAATGCFAVGSIDLQVRQLVRLGRQLRHRRPLVPPSSPASQPLRTADRRRSGTGRRVAQPESQPGRHPRRHQRHVPDHTDVRRVSNPPLPGSDRRPVLHARAGCSPEACTGLTSSPESRFRRRRTAAGPSASSSSDRLPPDRSVRP